MLRRGAQCALAGAARIGAAAARPAGRGPAVLLVSTALVPRAQIPLRHLLPVLAPLSTSAGGHGAGSGQSSQQPGWRAMASGALALTTAAALMAASSGGRPEEAHSDAAVSRSSSDNGTGDGKGHPDASRSTEELTAEQSRWFAAGMVKPGLREIPLAEVQQHGAKAERVWVTYKDGVYDVTDFVVAHPGGNKILLAAGGSIEPFWALYANHKTAEVMKILEGMRIGNLAQADREAARRAPKAADANDPYGREPARHPALRINMKQPFNAETPPELLTESLITPNDIFYVRNHLPVPIVDPATYRLEVRGTGVRRVFLSLDDLKNKFKSHHVTGWFAVTLQCAGNRRKQMADVKSVKGIGWTEGAISTAEWTGVRMRDVLQYAGLVLDEDDRPQGGACHVCLEGLDAGPGNDNYGVSIPIERALDPRCEVLLAFEMNGKPLPLDHGFPVRVIVPGVAGARNVKWLGRIAVSKKESDKLWQARDYKAFSPSATPETVDYDRAAPIHEMPVNSAITTPASGSKVSLQDEEVLLKGYAISGGGHRIVRVDITTDGGKSWQEAELNQFTERPGRNWAWTLWEASVKLPATPGPMTVAVRAVDEANNSQPENVEAVWNLRGLVNNAWHRIDLEVTE